METGTIYTLLLFAVPFIAVLIAAVWLLQRGGRGFPVFRRPPKANDTRTRIAYLLQDDIGQKFAAARVNLSALRTQLRTGGKAGTADLDAAMNLLDDGCRDLRTVSRLMADDEAAASKAGTRAPDGEGKR